MWTVASAKKKCNSCRARSNADYGMRANCCLLWYRLFTITMLRSTFVSFVACSISRYVYDFQFGMLVFLLVHSFASVFAVFYPQLTNSLCVYNYGTVYFPFYSCFALHLLFGMLSCAIKIDDKTFHQPSHQLMLYSIFVCCCNCSLNQGKVYIKLDRPTKPISLNIGWRLRSMPASNRRLTQ